MAPFWHPFGDVRGLFRLAFSAFAHLEPQGEPFQHHFVDLVSFLVPLLRIVDALLLKMYKILGGRLAPLRGRGRAAGAARRPLRRHFPFLFCGRKPLGTYQCSATLPAQWCFPFFGSSGFYRFGKDFGTAIWMFLTIFGTTIVFFGMRVYWSRFLKILGSESGCLGLQNQAFCVEGIAKTSFSHMSGL